METAMFAANAMKLLHPHHLDVVLVVVRGNKSPPPPPSTPTNIFSLEEIKNDIAYVHIIGESELI